MPLVYEEEFTVFQFECDPWDRMTPGAVLRRVQEISSAHCNHLDITQKHYEETHTLFLLSRLSLQVGRMPQFEEKVCIQTRAYGMHRAVYQRVTSLYCAKTGELLCETDTRWVLVDTRTRHILRKEPEGFNSPFTDLPGAEGHEMQMPKMGEASESQTLCATYTLCDRNGHLNNARYADLVCDMLPIEQLEKGPVRKMLLMYKAEIGLMQAFTLNRHPANGGGFGFVASQHEQKNFECFVNFDGENDKD